MCVSVCVHILLCSSGDLPAALPRGQLRWHPEALQQQSGQGQAHAEQQTATRGRTTGRKRYIQLQCTFWFNYLLTVSYCFIFCFNLYIYITALETVLYWSWKSFFFFSTRGLFVYAVKSFKAIARTFRSRFCGKAMKSKYLTCV